MALYLRLIVILIVSYSFAQAKTTTVSNQTELDAAINSAQGGDIIVLEAGSYGDLSVGGKSPSSLVVIQAKDGDTAVVLSISSEASSSNWSFSGLKVRPNRKTTAVKVFGSNHSITNLDISFTESPGSWSASDWVNNAGTGIWVDGDNIKIENNVVSNVDHGIDADASNVVARNNLINNFAGDGIRAFGDHSVFEYNTVKNCLDVDGNHDDGFQSWTSGPDGVGSGVITGIVLRGNTFINYEDENQPLRCTLQGIGMFDGTYKDWVIENNVVITDHWHGISVLGGDGVRVVNNTVIDINNEKPGPLEIRMRNHKNGTPPKDCLVRNNIATGYVLDSGVTADNNIEITFSDYSTHFQNFGTFDLRLKSGSSAIDAGTSELAPALDRNGAARPFGAKVDLGAYEFGAKSTLISAPVDFRVVP